MFKIDAVSKDLFCVDFKYPGLRPPDIGTNESMYVYGIFGAISLKKEILDWIKESNLGHYIVAFTANYERCHAASGPISASIDIEYNISFTNEADMLAFKLKWL